MLPFTTDGAAAPELDRTLGTELETLAEIFGLFAVERVQFMQRAVDHEVPVREQAVTLPQELKREVQVTPTPQLPRVQVAAPQVTVFRLGSGEHIGLVLRLEDEELPAVVLQRAPSSISSVLGDLRGYPS